MIEVKNKQAEAIPDHTIEIRDACLRGSMQAGNAICGRAPCGFTDRGIGTKDAKERQMSMRKLILVVLMCAIFMSVEVFGGIRANSLAILTDAAHLLSDIVAFAISLFSIWASGWEATPYQSYGFFRMEVLGALASIQLIWLLTGILVYQAISRLLHDAGKVEGHLMFAVAAFGFVVNIAMALMLHHKHEHGLSGHANGCSDHGHNHAHAHGHGDGVHGHNHHDITITADDDDVGHSKHKDDDHETLLKNQECADHVDRKNSQKRQNINIHSAYLHVLGDSIQSVGVMIGGAIIWYKPEWKIIDLICTLIFSIIVLGTTINMLRNILEVLMESTPREIDVMRLEKGLCDMDGVLAIHELHIWSITVGKVLLSCHLTITPDADADLLLGKVVGYIKREYNIANATIQMERT